MLDPKAHQAKDDFRAVKSPADIPDFCGRCHSNIEYMRHFNPSPRTDQLAEYWTSGHGKQLKKGDHASGHLHFLPRSAARQCHRSDAARHSSGERTDLAGLPHEGGPDLCEVPFRPEAHGGAYV